MRVCRDRLQRAIEGTACSARFRDLLDREGLADQWYAFATDRRLGRARDFLAAPTRGASCVGVPWTRRHGHQDENIA